MLIDKQLTVTSDGLRLAGGLVVPAEPRGFALLLHGIPSAAPAEPGDAGYPGLARTFAERGWAAAWVDMRGVRSSEGFFSIEGWVHDARAAFLEARSASATAGLPAAIVGSSGGGAVAVEATRRGLPVDALVLLATPAAWVSFAGDPDEAIHRITVEAGLSIAPEVVTDPGPWIAEFESVVTEEAVGAVDLPILVVHGTADDVVPSSHASRIVESAPRADLKLLEGGAHQLRKDPEAVRIALDWLEGVL